MPSNTSVSRPARTRSDGRRRRSSAVVSPAPAPTPEAVTAAAIAPAVAVVAGSFAELGVPTPLVASLAQGGITTPFPIQNATLPDSLAGRDVLGRGRTGSGLSLIHI